MIKLLGLRIGALLCAAILFIFSGNSIYSQDFEEIIGGNSPDDFSNFSNTVPDPTYTGDASYSIDLGTVKAGGGLDFPLVLTYNTNRIKVGASSGHVGLGWDLNIGEVVRSLNCIPDEQSNEWFDYPSNNPAMDLGHHTVGTGLGYTLEGPGTINGGDVLSDLGPFDDWDDYNISTPYDSKKLIPIRKGILDDIYFLERPYSTWYVDFVEDIQGTSSILQFQVKDDNARTFLFNKPHNIYIDKDGDGLKTSNDYYSNGSGADPFLYYTYPTSWKLTRIDAPYSDHYVEFIYDEYARVASGNAPYSNQAIQYYNNMDLCGKSVFNDFDMAHISYDESTIQFIETRSQTIEFVFENDPTALEGGDTGNPVHRRRLKAIHFQQKGSGEIFKKIELSYRIGSSPIVGTTITKSVSLLKNIRFSDLKNFGKHEFYTFTYYSNPNTDYEDQYYGYVGKYNYMDIITLPTGGKINFDYEERRFNYHYEEVADWGLRQRYASNTDNTGPGYLAGSRVEKITLDTVEETAQNNPTIVKHYNYGDAIRIESRFQDLMTDSSFPIDQGYSFAKGIMSHVGHRWVEIVDSEGGFTKNYYTSGITNGYLNYWFCDSYTDCPEDITEEEAKSIFYESNNFHSNGVFLDDASFLASFKPLYDTYNEIYGKVYKSETGYLVGNDSVFTQTSESKWNFIESEFQYPSFNFSDVLNVQQSIFVYNYHTKKEIDEKETHTYYANFFRYAACGENYEYRFRNDELNFLGSPLNKLVLNSDYENFYRGFSDFSQIIDNPNFVEHLNSAYIERKYTLSDEFPTDVCWFNDLNTIVGNVIFRDEATFVNAGRTTSYSLIKNIYEQLIDFKSYDTGYPYPLVFVQYEYSSHENPFHSGWFNLWDDRDGFWRPREMWVLETIGEAGTCELGVISQCDIDDYGRKAQTFDAYNDEGEVVETSDVLGKKYTYQRAGDGSIIGIFENATIDNVFAHSFSYEGLEEWNIHNSDGEDTEFSISDGKLRLTNYASASNGETDRIYYNHGSEISGDVIIEFDVKIANSSSWDLTIAAGGSDWTNGNGGDENAIWSSINNESWKYHNGTSSNYWVTIKSDFEVGKTYSFKIVAKTGINKADYYVDGKKYISNGNFRKNSSGIQTIAFGNYGYGNVTTNWYIDNVRMYPASAQATSQELAASGRTLAIKGIDGSTERFDYDGHNRLSAYTNKSGNTTSVYDYNFTSNLNGNGELVYSSSNPNYRLSISTANAGPDDYLISRLGLEKFEINPRIINLGDVNALDSPSEFSVALWFNRFEDIDFDPTHNGIDNVLIAQSSNSSYDNFEIGTEGSNIEVYLDTPDYDGTLSFNAGIENEKWYHLAFTYHGGNDQAKVYLNGKLVKTWNNWGGSLDNSLASPLTLGAAGPDDLNIAGVFSGHIANVKVYGYNLLPEEIKSMSGVRSTSYFDGLGRPIQEQVSSADKAIVMGQFYDHRGLNVAASRPISDQTSSGYVPNLFGAGFTPGGALPGSSPIEQYYDDHVSASDAAYAYSFTEYEESRTNRVLKTTLPGDLHKLGSDNENAMTYTLNTVPIITPEKTWATGSLYKTIAQDPEDKQKISYTNYLGQTVASGVDWDSNGELNGADDLVTTFKYDYNGNLILVEDPRGLLTTYNYNALGELLEKKLPDEDHPNKYCYDDKGRLRFHADPNDFANPFYYSQDQYSYTYTKYDEFDRPVEIGEQDASFVGNNSQASFEIICANSIEINDQNEPSANNNPMIIYSYDGVNAASGTRNHKGRLSRTQYKDPNTGSWGYTWYSYNELGLVEMIKQQMPGHNYYNDRTISYTYDELGRLVHVAYDEGYSSTGDHHFWYYYDGFGRLSKITSHQTNSQSSATKEAEYTYYADGHVEQLILGDGVQTIDYDYTIQGWLDDINNGLGGSGDVFSTNLEYDMSGNIVKNTWYQKGWYTSGFFPAYNYEYDNANRLKNACYGSSISTACPETSMSGFDVAYDYDNSGNLTRISRLDDAAHEMEYTNELESGTNKIDYVSVDGISGATQPQTKQFTYDANGNVIENELQGITDITYDWRNLPTKVIANGTTIKYTYDAEGNRVKKEVVGGETTYYIRGVDGQTFAAYSGYTIKFLNILAGGEIIGQIIKN